ncbi:MAG: hypothetical protein L0I62_04825 [Gammaproteobacteria bacterium]|nr:hypothetical protein [Gammaproteobacteria bacterium]
MNEFPAIAALLPHGPEALALDAVTAWEPGERATARLTVRPDLILYDEAIQGIPAWGSIEIMAQTLGVYAGLNAGSAEVKSSPGYLVGVRHFRVARAVLVKGLELDISAECRHCETWGLATFACRVRHAEEELVSAVLSVWRPRPPDSTS